MRQDALLNAVALQRNEAQNAHANALADLAVAMAMVEELRRELAAKEEAHAKDRITIGTITARLLELTASKE
jgi:hypothetical protein